MRYFGERSLSCFIHRLLPAAITVIVLLWFGLTLLLSVSLFSISLGDPVTSGIIAETRSAKALADPEWAELLASPPYVRILVLPYLAVIVSLMVTALWNARSLFANFRHNRIFDAENARKMRTISLLVIPFSILSFNFPSLLVGLILLLVTEILRNGVVLQEEHDMTV